MKVKIIMLPVFFYIYYQFGFEYLLKTSFHRQININQYFSSFNSSERENIRVHPGSSLQFQIETPVTNHPNDPNIILGAAITGHRTYNGGYTTGVYYSDDGGENWFGTDSLKNDSGNIIWTAGDPWVNINSDGRFLISYLVPYLYLDTNLNNTIIKFYMGSSYSTDFGFSWSNTSYVPNAINVDKDYIVSDNSNSSPYYGNIYAFFKQDSIVSQGNINNYMFSVSTNSGDNWSFAIRISNGYDTPAGIIVNTEGILYTSWSSTHLNLAKSTNGGNNWVIIGEPVLFLPNNTNDFVFYDFRKSVRLPVSMVCDNTRGYRNGWLFIVLSENFNDYDKYDVSIHRSTNGGVNWSSPFRVNRDSTGYFKYQFMPVINIDEYGGINIIYFDTRNTYTNDSCEIFMSRSIDGGNNFNDIRLSDHKFKPENIDSLFGINDIGYGGSYIGITSNNEKIIPFWYDNSTGQFQVWTASVKIGPSLFHTIPFKKTIQQNGSLIIRCKPIPVTSPISNVKLYYAKDSSDFSLEEMSTINDTIWESKISISGEGIYKYYFSATDEREVTVYLPDESPDSLFYFFASSDTANPQLIHTGITIQPLESWPVSVVASVFDSTGIDSVWVLWNKNSYYFQNEFKLNNLYGNVYSGEFDSSGIEIQYKDRIYYKIFARDNSVAYNIDSSELYYFDFRKTSLCEDFTDSDFPPANWDTNFTGTNFWTKINTGSFGHDSASAKFDFYNSSVGISQSITSAAFTSSSSNELLKFSYAHAPRGTGTDSLFIETSLNNGNTYTSIDTLWGNTFGGELNTAPETSSEFIPSASQWINKEYSLSSGINKLRFSVKSGAGNNLFIDSICVVISAIPEVDTIKLIPEGFYNLQTGFLNSKDTVRVYLRDTISPYIKIDSSSGILDSATFLCPVLFQNANTKNYYLRIVHRNTLETWSRPFLYTRGVSFIFDFTDSLNKAYGSNMILKGSKYCIFSGDLNRDGAIEGTDIALVDNAAFEFLTGYEVSDITGDGVIEGGDLSIIDNNSFSFIISVIP